MDKWRRTYAKRNRKGFGSTEEREMENANEKLMRGRKRTQSIISERWSHKQWERGGTCRYDRDSVQRKDMKTWRDKRKHLGMGYNK